MNETLAIVVAVLYAARGGHRLPETPGEKVRAIDECLKDAKMIMAATAESRVDGFAPSTITATLRSDVAAPASSSSPPSPPPGEIGRDNTVETKTTRRRG